jgi:hypothetical protein
MTPSYVSKVIAVAMGASLLLAGCCRSNASGQPLQGEIVC